MAFVFDFGFGLMHEVGMNFTILAYVYRYGANGSTLETDVWKQVEQLMKEAMMETPKDPIGRIQITRRLRILLFKRERTMVCMFYSCVCVCYYLL